MSLYHKIQTVYLRNPDTKYKTLMEGHYALPEFEFLAENTWVFTEKVDGTNIRVNLGGYNEEDVAYGITFGGRTEAAQLPAPLVGRLEELFHSNEARSTIVEVFPDAATLYGEGYGGRIQKGGKYRQDQSFVLFDVKVGDWWLQRADVEDVASRLGLDVVPVLCEGTLPEMVKLVQEGMVSAWGEFQAEGIVARPKVELKARSGYRIITKIKGKDFALTPPPDVVD